MKLRLFLIILFSMALMIGCTDAEIEAVQNQIESVLSTHTPTKAESASPLPSSEITPSPIPSPTKSPTPTEALTPTPSPSSTPTPTPLQYSFSASAEPENGGYLTGFSNGIYDENSDLHVWAHPNSEYIFHSWLYNGSQIDEPPFYNFTLTEDTVITAQFVTPTPTPFTRPGPILPYDVCHENDVWTGIETVPLQNAQIGKLVQLGTYEQDNDLTNGSEPIDWIVLDIQDNKAFLLSRYVLMGTRYHHLETPITWAECQLRDRLNSDFYNDAFTQSEKGCILLTHNINPDNPIYGTDGGADTDDYVFLLSLDEVNQYLTNDYFPFAAIGTGYPHRNLARGARPTPYAFAQKAYSAYSIHGETALTADNTWYYLRTPGKDSLRAAVIHASSDIYEYGFGITAMSESLSYWNKLIATTEGVRPALWVDLSAVP